MSNASCFSIRIPGGGVTERPEARVCSRKTPKQARSAGVVAAILEAAVQVLAAEGAHRFTTARVAKRAGVSVGSLYQYFPNKESILFRLQADEWRQNSALLRSILQDGTRAPLERLRTLVGVFIRSECAEAGVRMALDDAAPFYRDAPEARAVKGSGASEVAAFMAEALPKATDEVRRLTAELVETTLTQAGKRFSETPRTAADIEAFAGAMGDMICLYVRSLGQA